MFENKLTCECGYVYLTIQTDEKLSKFEAKKWQKIHQIKCDKQIEIESPTRQSGK